MNKFFNFCMLFVALATGLSCTSDDDDDDGGYFGTEEGKTTQEFRVMTFNVRVNSVNRDGTSKDWEVRKKAAIAMVKDKKPTIMGVQESYWVGQWDYLKAQLEAEGYACVGKAVSSWSEPPTINSQVVGIFYRTAEVTLNRWGVFSLSETPDEPSVTPGFGGDYCRQATWAEFKLNTNGRRIFIVNTHLDTKSDAVRKKGLDLIVERIAMYNPDKLRTFITGDLNTGRSSGVFTELKKTYSLAGLTATVGNTGDFSFNNYSENLNNRSHLDHIFYSKGMKIHAYYVVMDSYYEDVPYISDHYPCYGVFSY